MDILKAHTTPQPWWLGYLDTGAHDMVFNTAPKVTLYWGWRYVLLGLEVREPARSKP